MDVKKVVITGATSSLGTALIDECIKQHIEVLAICNPHSRNMERITKHELVTIMECELSELSGFCPEEDGCHKKDSDVYSGCDAFIHLAWASTQGDAARNKLQPQAKNIQYALDAVDLAERLGCKVFVGAGSQAEYGRTNEILTEETPCHPETAYGMAKLCAGQMTKLSCKQKGIKHIWPRILSAYGPNCQPQTIINYTLTELLQGRRPSLSGGEQIWDFIYTGDVARALLLLAEKGHDGEVYVIGSGNARQLKEYLQDVREIVAESMTTSDVDSDYACPELGMGDRPYGENTVMHLACDTCKLKQDTGFETETSFEEGIRKTILWIMEQKTKL